ncbi:magnesium and cobalt transport protein CorA, partial [bacterium]|nr:magnesium and cobalt transport protein CorA [bacterium]
MEKTRLRVTDFTADRLNELEFENFEELYPFRENEGISWINIDGLHDTEALAELAEHFGLHSLVMEDVVSTHQRAKFEDYPEHIFIVLRMLYLEGDKSVVKSEQVSLIFGEGWVFTFQERTGDIFEGVRNRLRAGKARLRKSGSDYLAYALSDALIDHYFNILEQLGEKIEALEEGLLADPRNEHLESIHSLKRELVLVRRAIWPLREVIGNWIRSESPLVQNETQLFLRDVHDHTVQV